MLSSGNFAPRKVCMFSFHQWIDNAEGALLSRKTQAPIESQPADLKDFIKGEPRALHPDVSPAVLEFRLGEPEKKKMLTEHFSFLSPVKSPYPENNIVRGMCCRSESPISRRQAVVMVHGAFAPSFAAEELISAGIIENGADVFAMAAPYHMERAPESSEYSGQFLMTGDIPRFISGMLQGAADVRALIGALRLLPTLAVLKSTTAVGMPRYRRIRWKSF